MYLSTIINQVFLGFTGVWSEIGLEGGKPVDRVDRFSVGTMFDCIYRFHYPPHLTEGWETCLPERGDSPSMSRGFSKTCKTSFTQGV